MNELFPIHPVYPVLTRAFASCPPCEVAGFVLFCGKLENIAGLLHNDAIVAA